MDPANPDSNDVTNLLAVHWRDFLLAALGVGGIAAAVWGQRIAMIARDVWRWLCGVTTGNAKLWSRVDTFDERLGKIEPDLAKIAMAVARMEQIIAPVGEPSTREFIELILRRQTVSDARMQDMRNNDSVARFECDANGACTYANMELCRMYGLTDEQMLGNGWLSAVPSTHREAVFAKWEHAVHHRIPYDYEYPVSRGGKTVQVLARATAVPGSDGKPLLYLGTVTPITG